MGAAGEARADGVRLDKWLWAARFFKSRSLAAAAVEGGKVKLNGQRIKPAKAVRLGDAVEIQLGEQAWQVSVRGLSERRGGADMARALYEESPESQARRAQEREKRRLFQEPAAQIHGRPTKRDRRRLARLTRS